MGFFKKLVKGIGSALGSAAGGNILGAGASVLGSLLGKSSSDNANAANMQINQMNNQFNKEMAEQSQVWNLENMAKQQEYNMTNMQYQNQFNREMLERQLYYNSAQQQANRLRAAGLNPALTMGQGGQAGIVQSGSGGSPSSSTPSASSASPIPMQAFHPDFSGITQSMNSLSEIAAMKGVNRSVEGLNDANADKAKSERNTIEQLRDLQKEGLINDNGLKRLEYMYSFSSFNRQMRRQELENRQLEESIRLVEAQNIQYDLQNSKMAYELQFLPEQVQNSLAMQVAQIDLAKESIGVARAQIKMYLDNAAKFVEETRGIKLNNDIIERTTDDLVNIKKQQSRLSYWNAEEAKYRFNKGGNGIEKGSPAHKLLQFSNYVGDIFSGLNPFKSFITFKH